MKKKINYLSLVVLIVLIAFASVLGIISNNITANSTIIPKTKLKICITDVKGKPIKDAKVTIVEDNIFFFTDDKGNTPTIEVTYLPNRLDSQANWSTVTILVHKEDYVDTMIFNCVVYLNRTRNGPTIPLLLTSQTSFPVVSIVETPPPEWIEQYANSHK